MKILKKEVVATVSRVALTFGISRQSVQKTVNTLIIDGDHLIGENSKKD